jgi:enamine deaminase RidA (YjgF/YER057c/UK114 family)
VTKPQAIFPANRHALYEEHRYSAAIRSGDLLFVSGQVGSRSDGTAKPDLEPQVQLAFDNLEAARSTISWMSRRSTRIRRASSQRSWKSGRGFSPSRLIPTGLPLE